MNAGVLPCPAVQKLEFSTAVAYLVESILRNSHCKASEKNRDCFNPLQIQVNHALAHVPVSFVVNIVASELHRHCFVYVTPVLVKLLRMALVDADAFLESTHVPIHDSLSAMQIYLTNFQLTLRGLESAMSCIHLHSSTNDCTSYIVTVTSVASSSGREFLIACPACLCGSSNNAGMPLRTCNPCLNQLFYAILRHSISEQMILPQCECRSHADVPLHPSIATDPTLSSESLFTLLIRCTLVLRNGKLFSPDDISAKFGNMASVTRDLICLLMGPNELCWRPYCKLLAEWYVMNAATGPCSWRNLGVSGFLMRISRQYITERILLRLWLSGRTRCHVDAMLLIFDEEYLCNVVYPLHSIFIPWFTASLPEILLSGAFLSPNIAVAVAKSDENEAAVRCLVTLTELGASALSVSALSLSGRHREITKHCKACSPKVTQWLTRLASDIRHEAILTACEAALRETTMLSLGAFVTQFVPCTRNDTGTAVSITKKVLVSAVPRWASVVLRHGARIFGPELGRVTAGGLDARLRTIYDEFLRRQFEFGSSSSPSATEVFHSLNVWLLSICFVMPNSPNDVGVCKCITCLNDGISSDSSQNASSSSAIMFSVLPPDLLLIIDILKLLSPSSRAMWETLLAERLATLLLRGEWRRIVDGSSLPIHSFLEGLRVTFGDSFTNRLRTLVADAVPLTGASSESKWFLHTLRQGCWPTSIERKAVWPILPVLTNGAKRLVHASFDAMLCEISEFYKTRYPQRRLILCPFVGSVLVEIGSLSNNRCVEVEVSYNQAIVLQAFNIGTKARSQNTVQRNGWRSFADIQSFAQLSETELADALNSLLDAAHVSNCVSLQQARVLIIDSPTGVLPTNNFAINANLQSPAFHGERWCCISTVNEDELVEHASEDVDVASVGSSTIEALDNSRSNQLDAALVFIIKTRSHIDQTTLISKAQTALQLRILVMVPVEQLILRLNSLIERGYISVETTSGIFYNYIP